MGPGNTSPMPPAAPAPGGTFRRRILLLAVPIIALGAYGFVELGTFMAREDPLQKADAIFVLAGTTMRRPLEAADLYAAGYGPKIVLTHQTRDAGEDEVLQRGLIFAEDIERVHELFLVIGIPADDIIVPRRIHDSTAAEAITLRELAQRYGWRRVLVVSSKYHLRRAAFAFSRELRGTGVQLIMRGTKYEDVEPGRWWRHRSDIREIMYELSKLIAYVLGLGA